MVDVATQFEGRVALITGGARGLGRAFGRALADLGAHAVLTDVDEAAVDKAAREITEAGGQASAYRLDVADEAAWDPVLTDVAAVDGGVDILINNAGLHSLEYGTAWAKLPVSKLRRLFDVNVMGVMIGTLAVRPHMQGRPGANVLNISSSAAFNGMGAYGATKAAVRGLTLAWARELGPEGIRVNALAPGLHVTDTIRQEFTPQMIEGHRHHQFLDLEGNEQDIVDAMLYLCSAKARFVTGETMRVTAGYASSL
ncbi:short-chain dehydrogenase [Parafrankia colletiae]|uniref:Short-chain dehydrogenase n=2 Tax=Parafrankia TaxID=2994362 RepID=A0A1S1Q854_9ACTN|nr:SDR family oxidoreductase [Parafrankia colletiae]OHV29661.1 short-chain dehydrogenase [Parafrankia colletiae]